LVDGDGAEVVQRLDFGGGERDCRCGRCRALCACLGARRAEDFFLEVGETDLGIMTGAQRGFGRACA
jgi:hypothetical protein